MPEVNHGTVQSMPAAPAYPTPLVIPQQEVLVTPAELVPARGHAAPAAVNGRAAAAMSLVESVGETHAAFVERQAQAHTSFLKMRGEMLAMAAGRRSSLTVDAAASPVALTSAPPPAAAPVIPPRTAMPVAPVTPPTPPAPADPPAAPTPAPEQALWSRAQLEVLAGGKISEVFGPLFAEQDQYDRLVRMPEPPLLLADRVMSIEGEPGTMGTGRIVTETDVDPDAWYMHNGRMSPGVVIESGQADLLLASWLGADFHQSRRARLPPARLRSDVHGRTAQGRRDAALRHPHRRPRANRRHAAVLLPLRLLHRRSAADLGAQRAGRLLLRRGAEPSPTGCCGTPPTTTPRRRRAS